MTQRFTAIIEQGEDGYLLSDVLELPGCHTQAKTYDKLIERTKEAISLYLEVEEMPEINSTISNGLINFRMDKFHAGLRAFRHMDLKTDIFFPLQR